MNRLFTTIIVVFLTSTLYAKGSTSSATNLEPLKILNEQQYLSKHMSKLYLAFEANPKNTETQDQIKNDIQSFHNNHIKLVAYKKNTKKINEKLTKIGKTWTLTHQLTEISEQQKMFFSMVEDLNKELKELRTLYKQISK